LACRNRGVAAVAAEQQHHERAGSDASDAYDLAGDVDDAVLVEQETAVGGQAVVVAVQQVVQAALEGGSYGGVGKQVAHRNDDGRVALELRAVVPDGGEAVEGTEIVAGAGLGEAAAQPFAAAGLELRGEQGLDLVGLGERVPDVQRGPFREGVHRLPVGPRGGLDRGPPLPRGEAAVPGGDLDAGQEPLDIPLPRSAQGLVEVIDVEDQAPFGGSEEPEVRQVRVPAELHGDAGRGRRGEVGSHHRGCAAVEGEGRDGHPSVADRQQLLDPGRVLRGQHRQRVPTRWQCRQLGVSRSRWG
jgi:hypothetical protein